MVRPRQGSAQQEDPVEPSHHVHYYTNSSKRLLFKPLTHIQFSSAIQFLPRNSAVIYFIYSAPRQTPTAQFAIHLIQCRRALHLV